MPKKKPDSMPAAPSDATPKAGERDYEAEGHLRTLLDAEMIKQDPEKMAKLHKLAGNHQKAITSIQGLRDLHQQKFGPGAKKAKAAGPDSDDSDLGT